MNEYLIRKGLINIHPGTLFGDHFVKMKQCPRILLMKLLHCVYSVMKMSESGGNFVFRKNAFENVKKEYSCKVNSFIHEAESNILLICKNST